MASQSPLTSRKQIQRFVALSEECGGVEAEPFIEHGGVDLAEVDRVDEVAVFEFRQARVFADDARFDFATDEEHRCA